MIFAGMLLTYTALLAFGAQHALPWTGWTRRSPRLALAVWSALSASVVVSLVLAGLGLATPWLMRQVPQEFQDRFGTALAGPYAEAGATVYAALGAAGAAAVLGRITACLAAQHLRAARERRCHAGALAVVGRPDPDLGALVVDHAVPAAYCLPGALPGGRRRVVVTTAALRLLDGDQLAAVLEHERAHLRGHHHRRLATAEALARALPFVPLFRYARDEGAVLVEMIADDAAARRHTPPTLAAALLSFARAGVPSPALAAGGHALLRRVDRLLTPPRPLGIPGRLAGALTATGALGLPPALACVPLAVVGCLTAVSMAGR